MTDRRMITDRLLRSLRPAPRGQRIEVFDTRVPGYGVVVPLLLHSVDGDSMPALRTKYLACLSIHLRWQGIILRGFFPRSPGARISPQVPMRTDLVEYEQAYR